TRELEHPADLAQRRAGRADAADGAASRRRGRRALTDRVGRRAEAATGRLGRDRLRFPLGAELAPLAEHLQVLVQDVVRRDLRLKRRPAEVHPRLLERLSALPVVARAASADQVLPAVLAALVARDDVVERQVASAHSAVLAGVVVSDEHLFAAE